MKFILGKKIGMTEIFTADGKRTPVTLIEAGPCQITQIKIPQKDGYSAAQLGYIRIDAQKIKKSQTPKPFKFLKEYRLSSEEIKNLNLNDQIDATIFTEGEVVKVSGISKGKGFQGAV